MRKSTDPWQDFRYQALLPMVLPSLTGRSSMLVPPTQKMSPTSRALRRSTDDEDSDDDELETPGTNAGGIRHSSSQECRVDLSS